jgi:cytochrome c oxidase subunit 3
MFCAYAIFRSYRPDVFEFSSHFLNTTLGAVNTSVLLFSSLTMAWAVRASQLEQHRTTALMLTITLCCATVFLGVKAIEYSHKWSMGLMPGKFYTYPNAPQDAPNYLLLLCIVPGLFMAGLLAWFVKCIIDGDKFHTRVAGPLVAVAGSFFLGVLLGAKLEGGHADHGSGHADEHPAVAAAAAPTLGATAAEAAAVATISNMPETTQVLERMAKDVGNSGVRGNLAASEKQAALATGLPSGDVPTAETSSEVTEESSRNYLASIFFSIYYCMTGIHAIHIIGGIVVLVWLLYRAVREDFNRQYFGPVDYVGLYWHLVDLIWIYLFPLMYLIR